MPTFSGDPWEGTEEKDLPSFTESSHILTNVCKNTTWRRETIIVSGVNLTKYMCIRQKARKRLCTSIIMLLWNIGLLPISFSIRTTMVIPNKKNIYPNKTGCYATCSLAMYIKMIYVQGSRLSLPLIDSVSY